MDCESVIAEEPHGIVIIHRRHCSKTMSLLTTLHHPFLLPRNTSAFPRLIRPQKLNRHQSRSSPTAIKSLHKGHEQQQESKPTWENVLSTAASLYPVYVTVGGVVACVKPSAFSWFVKRGPASYSFSLGFIMLAMGLTLELRDLIGIFVQRPLSQTWAAVLEIQLRCLTMWTGSSSLEPDAELLCEMLAPHFKIANVQQSKTIRFFQLHFEYSCSQRT